MTRFLPKSLIGQLLLLVAVTLLVAQAINIILLYRGAQNQKIIEASVSAVGRITGEIERMNDGRIRPPRRGREDRPRRRRNRPSMTAQSVIDPQHPRLPAVEDRAILAFENMGVVVQKVEAARVDRLPPALIDNVVGHGRGRLKALRAVGIRNRPDLTDGYILMAAQLRDGQWLNIAAVVRDRNPLLLRSLVVQTLVIYLILLLPLIWLGRNISRPLQALTRAAQNTQPGERTAVTESGPPDTRQLIAAFNAMNVRVDAMLGEKDVMLGAIGHDLRTPLAALRVRVESVEDDEQRQKMIAGIDDMDRTLDDILSLARLGRGDEAVLPTDISALIETVADEFTDQGKAVSFTRSGRITAPIRATLIRRALRNLIGNAVTYGQSATIIVEKPGDIPVDQRGDKQGDKLADKQGDKPVDNHAHKSGDKAGDKPADKYGDKLAIHIDDQGPGIAGDQIEAMFEPFARGETSRNRATGGSGLGLTLARAIMRDQGGDVTLENRPEGGLRATLILGV
ncbi:MAG: ATP-binding protein [Parasphingorhabdus sp.]|uniref:HAMP domain-containing sensor histidine kinase n=1 Tax=Parasphingorhabdus sp. TaxID=2709688 RepID=UPI003296F67D